MKKTLIAIALLLAAASVSASEMETRVAGELDRLDATLKEIEAKEPGPDLAPVVESSHKSIERVRNTKDPLVRVYRMRDVFSMVGALQFLVEHKAASNDLAQVEALEQATRAGIEQPLAPMRGPALQLALRQGAHNHAQVLHRAAVPFAKVSEAGSGLYYLGSAEGNRLYREFIESLPFEKSDEPRPKRAALEAAMRRLDSAALATFARDPGGTTAVGQSARMKEAHELFDRGSFEGAALMLLEAQLDVSRKNAEAKVEGTPIEGAGVHADSLTTMLQGIAREEAGNDTARIVTNDMVPLYGSLYRNVPAQKKPERIVTITLVRWPYT